MVRRVSCRKTDKKRAQTARRSLQAGAAQVGETLPWLEGLDQGAAEASEDASISASPFGV
jgi:hypothetical protein